MQPDDGIKSKIGNDKNDKVVRIRGNATGRGLSRGQLFSRLQRENAELRNKAVDLALEIQSFRENDAANEPPSLPGPMRISV